MGVITTMALCQLIPWVLEIMCPSVYLSIGVMENLTVKTLF